MFNKLVICGIILGAVVMAYFILFATHDFMIVAGNTAANSTYAANMTGLVEVSRSYPWWGMIIPGVVGIIAIVLTLRAPEKR